MVKVADRSLVVPAKPWLPISVRAASTSAVSCEIKVYTLCLSCNGEVLQRSTNGQESYRYVAIVVDISVG